METITPTPETHKPSILRKAANFVTWHTVGKHQVDAAVNRAVAEDPHLLDRSPIATMTQDVDTGAIQAFGHQGEELHPRTGEPIEHTTPPVSPPTETIK
jgi:hypothetical protein